MDTGCRDGFPPVSAEPAATMGFAMCGAAEAPVEAEPEAGDQPPIHRRPNLPTGHLLNSSCHMAPAKSRKIEINRNKSNFGTRARNHAPYTGHLHELIT